MQQTETYKLNLIETSDPFSPQALNENTQKLEEVVSEKLEDMDRRIQVFEAQKIVVGSYTTSVGNNFFYDLGFHPKLVLISAAGSLTADQIMSSDSEHGEHNNLKLTETGFLVRAVFCSGQYSFLAIG